MNTFEQQWHLDRLGFYKDRVDGLEGPNTRNARSQFLVSNGYVLAAARHVLATEQLIMKLAGIDPGPIDGLMGPKTRDARAEWQRGNWRDALMGEVKADDRFPDPVKNTWPTQSNMRSFFGEPGKNLVTFDLPYPMRIAWDTKTTVKRMTAHEKVKDSTIRVLDRVLKVYGMDEIRRLRLDLYGGTYNNRAMRGGTALSTHAYGIAHDFDPERNQLNWGRDKASFARPEYNEWWDAWTDEGWLSLGKARNFDWMHVQAARLG